MLKDKNPNMATNAPSIDILFPPNLSIRYPTKGAAILASSCPSEKAIDSCVRLQPYSDSRDSIHKPADPNDGADKIALTTRAVIAIHQP